MKKVFILFAFTFLMIFLSSCLKTLHPIFTVNDIVYEQKLLGTWKTETQGGIEFAVITNLAADNAIDLPNKIAAIKQKGYLVTYKDKDGKLTEQHIAFLVKLGKHLYFDYFPVYQKIEEKMDDFFQAHFVKMHTSFRVEIKSDGSFELSQLDESYVTKLIEEKKIRISHEKDSYGDFVITATTEELQQYIIKYGDEPAAYRSEKTIFTK